MIYQILTKLKETLAEKLQTAVYLDVPPKAKLPYITLGLRSVHFGRRSFRKRARFELKLVSWGDSKRKEEHLELLSRLQQDIFPLELHHRDWTIGLALEGEAGIEENLKNPTVGHVIHLRGRVGYEK